MGVRSPETLGAATSEASSRAALRGAPSTGREVGAEEDACTVLERLTRMMSIIAESCVNGIEASMARMGGYQLFKRHMRACRAG